MQEEAENTEHTEVVFDNAVVVLEVPATVGRVELDTAGVWCQLAVLLTGDSRTPVVWLVLMESVEQVGLIAPGNMVNGLGIVMEVGFGVQVEVVHLEQEGQAMPVDGKAEGLDAEVGVELAAALNLPDQHQPFLIEHPLLLTIGALKVGPVSQQFLACHAKSAHQLEPHAVCSQIVSVFHQCCHCSYQLLASTHQQSSQDGVFCPLAVIALSLHFPVHVAGYQHISSLCDQYLLWRLH